MGGFCLVVALALGGSVTNGATPSSFHYLTFNSATLASSPPGLMGADWKTCTVKREIRNQTFLSDVWFHRYNFSQQSSMRNREKYKANQI